MARLAICLAVASLAAAADPVGPLAPWGAHLAYGVDPQTSMSVMWSTRDAVDGAEAVATSVATGTVTRFAASSRVYADSNNTQFLHNATMFGLEAGGAYTYVLTSASGSASDIHRFTLQPVAATGPWGAGRDYPVLAIYGDMGVAVNAHKTLPLLTADVEAGRFDAILHVGDIAYDLQSNSGANGDAFVVQMEPIAGAVPVHLCPGNHEDYSDFGQFRARFDIMPGGAAVRAAQSVFHSFDIGLVHVVMFNSEAFFTVGEFSLLLLPTMFAWVEADLAAVNRSKTPWIITMAHQPMYCSPNDDDDDCHSLLSLMRDGVLGQYGFERLINQYGVEMHFGAHEHSYERNYPVYQLEWNGLTGPAAYVDYNHTVHIISGAAGCPENTDPWQTTANAFSAFRVADYGYGRLHVHNASHMYWEYVDDTVGAVLDSVWIVKHTHGPFVTAPAPPTSPALRARAIETAVAAVRAQPPPPAGAPAHVANRMSVETARALAAMSL